MFPTLSYLARKSASIVWLSALVLQNAFRDFYSIVKIKLALATYTEALQSFSFGVMFSLMENTNINIYNHAWDTNRAVLFVVLLENSSLWKQELHSALVNFQAI